MRPMHIVLSTAAIAALAAAPAVAGQHKHHEKGKQGTHHGWVEKTSTHDFDTTMKNLKAAIKAKGIHLFNEIDHAAGAAKINAELEPTTVVIFGKPQVGTPLMQCRRSVGVDLPMKILVWQEGDTVKVGTYKPKMLKMRHNLKQERCRKVLKKAGNVVKSLMAEATGA